MPKELPRREISESVEPVYRRTELDLQKRELKNTRRWTGVLKEPTTLRNDAIKAFSDKFRSEAADLKGLAKFDAGGVGGARTAEPLKQLTQRVSGDLGGYWNDIKQELASRSKRDGSPEDLRLSRALDWLEMAEREGGLSTWLEQWNSMWDSKKCGWDALAESIGNIKQAIAFSRELANHAFGDVNELGGVARDEAFKNRRDLIFALDAIAFEINRQAEGYLSGNTVKPGDPFAAIRERARDISPRANVKEHVRSELTNGTLHKTWAGLLPEAVRESSDTAGLSACLRDWTEKADAIDELLNGAYEAQDEVDAARALAAATGKAYQEAEKLASRAASPSIKHDPDDVSLALNTYDRICRELIARQKEMAQRLATDKARGALIGGVPVREARLAEDLFKQHEPTDSVYQAGLLAAKAGKLKEFWLDAKKYIDNELYGLVIEYGEMRHKFSETVGERVEDLLTCWAKRKDPGALAEIAAVLKKVELELNVTAPADQTYPLAWRMIATIRDLKKRCEPIFETMDTDTAIKCKNFVGRSFDTIADCIAGDVFKTAPDGLLNSY